MLAFNFAQRTLYDYRGLDGTGTAYNPATGSNAVSYTVRKLADGNCWMSENLKLTLSTSHAYEVATFSGGTTTWTPNSGSGDAYNVAINANTKANISVNGRNEWYYPWYAATAGQGTNASNPTINRSICPKGWRLPATATASSFQNLVDKYGNERSIYSSVPLSYTYTGYYREGINRNSSTWWFYWAANQATPAENAGGIFYTQAGPIKIGNNNAADGHAVRCVAIP